MTQSITVTDSVPRWVFMIALSALGTIICGLQVWQLRNQLAQGREQIDQGKLLVRFAVKMDSMERDTDKLEKRADLTQAKDVEQDSRILVLERHK